MSTRNITFLKRNLISASKQDSKDYHVSFIKNLKKVIIGATILMKVSDYVYIVPYLQKYDKHNI